MSEWISVKDYLPLSPMNGQSFECIEVIVSDGMRVHCTEFKCGGIPVAWCEFDAYGVIDRSNITHWQPLPEPPK